MARKDASVAAPSPRERPATYKGLGSKVGTIKLITPHPRNADFLNVLVKSVAPDGRELWTTYEAVPRAKFVIEVDGEVRPVAVGDDLAEHPPHNSRTFAISWTPFDGEKDDD